MSLESMLATVRNSVVKVPCQDGAGTGFFISPSGHVLTCNHVVPDSKAALVTILGDRLEAHVVLRDEAVDLAILKPVDAASSLALTMADPMALFEGQTVYALGHPYGLDFTITKGIISSLNRVSSGVGLLQTDVPLNPGNSGGPLVDESGRVVGVANGGIPRSDGIGFAVSLRHVFSLCARARVNVPRTEAMTIEIPITPVELP